ncbi:hypothetical protein FOZ63_024336, partial [Perkinsus olseni]
ATEFYGFVSALVCIIRMGDIVKDVYGTEIDRESLARQLKRKGRGGGVLGRLKAQDAARDEGGEQEVGCLCGKAWVTLTVDYAASMLLESHPRASGD